MDYYNYDNLYRRRRSRRGYFFSGLIGALIGSFIMLMAARYIINVDGNGDLVQPPVVKIKERP